MPLLEQGIESQAVPLVIRILDGVDAGTEIRLEGRALPYWPIGYRTSQRTKLTYYPGNPVGTQQVLGPIDEATTINGVWKDRFLGNGVAHRLATTFDDICRSGVSVEVVWGDSAAALTGTLENSAAPIVRRGILKNFEAKYDRVQDVAWTMEFEWRGRDEQTQAPLTSAGTQSSRDSFGAMSNSLTDLLDGLQSLVSGPFTTLTGVQQQTQQTLTEVSESLGRTVAFFNSTARAVATIADLPIDVLQRGRALARAAGDAARVLIPTLLSSDVFTGPAMGNRDEGLGLLDTRDQLFDVLHQADDSQELAAQVEETMAGVIEPEVIAEVAPVPGTDLRDLARQYYGDPDLWTVIANFNGLGTSQVPARPSGPTADANRPIKVPRRTEGSLAKLTQGAC